MSQISIGSIVKIDHPTTVLNPDEYFTITQMRYDTGCNKCWIAGENTCWFNTNMIVDIKENINVT
jgi:hypothetical protein